MNRLFITATDTDAGKTYVAQTLITALVNKGFKIAAYKPISAGCEKHTINQVEQLINEDALILSKSANSHQTISEINPIAFEEPIAPHIAAKNQDASIDIDLIYKHYQQCMTHQSDFLITEGAGGWRLPLGNGQFLSEFVQRSQQQVILVVNMKLGCLNHAILTYESIISDGLSCIGWVANCHETMSYLKENIAELQCLFPMPLLATLQNQPNIVKASEQYNLQPLLTP
jgi:dethiobiotin synthetase